MGERVAGRVELVEDLDEKRRALDLLVERFEPEPEPVKRRLHVEDRLTKVAIGRVHVDFMSGKQSRV